MGYEMLGVDCDRFLDDLTKLQSRWERKLTNLEQHGRGMWARGVLFGVEIGRARIAEDNPRSLAELRALLSEWEGIRARIGSSRIDETIRGFDFGIRLVIGRVRRFLSTGLDENPARPKPPTLADSGKA